MKKLKHIDEKRNISSLPPPPGMYCSSAGALLVTLLEATEDAIHEGHRYTSLQNCLRSQIEVDGITEKFSFPSPKIYK